MKSISNGVNHSKMIMVFSVICAGIFSAYLIAGGSLSLSNSSSGSDKNQKGAEIAPSLLDNQLGLVANQIDGNDFSSYIRNEEASKIRPGNLTDLLAVSTFRGIKNLDVSDEEAIKNFDINSPENQKIITETLKSVDSLKIGIQLTDISLKTSPDNSKTAKTAYLESLFSIFNNAFEDKSLMITSAQQVIDDINDDCFIKSGNSLSAKRAEVFKSIFDQYAALKTPSQWVDFHKQITGYYQNAYIIFESLTHCADDPVKGYAMSERLVLLIQNSVLIQKSFLEKCSEVGISCPK